MWRVEVMMNPYTESRYSKGGFKTEEEAIKYERKIKRLPVSFHSILTYKY